MNTESLVKAQASQAMASVEVENGNLKFNSLDTAVNSSIDITLFDASGKIIHDNGIPNELNKMEIALDQIKVYLCNDERWLIYDQQISEENNNIGVLRTATSLKTADNSLSGLLFAFAVAVPIYLLIAVLGGLFIAQRALSPIDKITKTAREIGRSSLSKRLNMKNQGDEVGRLAETFDEMLSRLETAFTKEKQFTADASHELRTPLAVIFAYTENVLTGQKSSEEYKEAAETTLCEIKKMKRIVTQLLILTRGDDNKYKPEYECFSLSSVITNIIMELVEVGARPDIRITYDTIEDIMVSADQTLIIQMLMNLIDNAIKYNKPNGTVIIRTWKKNDNVQIVVEDTGQGIVQEDIPYIFNRFYRGNKARSGDGAGLGLSIVKWIVYIHKGSISVKSCPENGTQFTVELPDYKQ
jgi:heavy metal sensor kinase